jgi:hypothetical protein
MDVAKQYAQRNRQGNEWFSHDSKQDAAFEATASQKLDVIEESAPLSTGAHDSSPATATPVREIQRAEYAAASLAETAEPDPIPQSPSSHVAGQIEQPSTPSVTPAKPDASISTPSSSGRAQMIKPTCDSNQWYKFGQDNAAGAQMRQPTTGRKSRPVSQPVDWFTHDGARHVDAGTEAKSRVTDQEGAAYCRRDKMGSSGTWFGHGNVGDTSAVQTRVTSREGASNASRMRNESENWFNHSANAGSAREPVHVAKGRVANRPQSNEMHGIFHHDG